MPGQTVQTHILEEQSDQGLHCLPFRLHRLTSLLYGRATKFKFLSDYNKFWVSEYLGNLRHTTVLLELNKSPKGQWSLTWVQNA